MAASEKEVAEKASERPKISKRSSFGVHSGYDPTGNTKIQSPEEELLVGEAYWAPDRQKVWKQVIIDDVHEDQNIKGGGRVLCHLVEDESALLEIPFDDMNPPVPVNPTVVDDITSLHFIHEAGILSNLCLRSKSNPPKPYTYMSNVLVAVNPLRRDLKFNKSMEYHQASPAEIFGMPPHPFGMAETVLRQMKQPKPLGANQAIVISGESGAGKTESFKIVLNHLLSGTAGKNSSEIELLEQRLHESNPMMEAIGNARTTRNHNSSRFGKFLKLLYENRTPQVEVVKGERAPAPPQNYVLVGAEIETYLLEKTRVVGQSPGEGNFHVLYALLSACAGKNPPAALAECRLNEGSGSHRYLLAADSYINTPGSFEVPPRELFDLTTAGLLKVGIPKANVDGVWQVLGAIIHLGDVLFVNDEASFEDGTRVAGMDAKRSLHIAATLLGITPAALLNLLTMKTIETSKSKNQKGGALIKPLSTEQASVARDSVAKLMYNIVFDWIIHQTNAVLSVNEHTTAQGRSLGLLDLFGFESFARNDMEQLLINLANEALQDMYCKQVLIAESLLYKSEGLRVEEITFVSNSGCVDLLVQGLVPLLDEQSQLTNGTDKRFLSNLYKDFKANKYLLLPHAKVRQECFCIRHYAEDVLYTVGSFTVKNDNNIPKDLTNTFLNSSLPLLSMMIQDANNHSSSGGDGSASPSKKRRAVTVAGEFARSMSQLTAELGRSQCSYIRCVKPNAMMKAGVFDQQYVVTQLRCLGLLQTCEVLKVGLPTRVPYVLLRDQFEAHMPKAVLDMYKHRGDKEFTMAALDVFDVPREYYHLGYTRLFFRPGRFTELDRILKSCRQVTADELAAKMRHQLMRRLWRLMLCRVRVGLMWIGALRTMREKRAKAMQLLKRNLHRKKVIKDWAALIMAEGERVEREKKENKAASKIALLFFDWCFRRSHLFRVKHPEGPRRKDDHKHHEVEKEMTEEEIREHHENFQKQAARLREIGGEAEMHRFREQEVARISPSDMNLRIKSLGAALKVFKKEFHCRVEDSHEEVKIEYTADGHHQVVHVQRHHKKGSTPSSRQSPYQFPSSSSIVPQASTSMAPQSPHMSRSAQKSPRQSPPHSPHSPGVLSSPKTPRTPYHWHSHVNSHSSKLDTGGVFTPTMLAQERVDSAMTSSVTALTLMTKQLKIMNPIDRLVKLNHKMHVANRNAIRSSIRMTEVAMALESMAAEDAKVKACGMLLFDAELILHNLFELQKWHKTRTQINENRSYNYKTPSTFAYHNLKEQHMLGPYGKLPHRFIASNSNRRQSITKAAQSPSKFFN